jgi:hypothetical protein
MGDIRNAYRIVVRKRKAERLLGRPRHEWEYNIKMDDNKYRYGLN